MMHIFMTVIFSRTEKRSIEAECTWMYGRGFITATPRITYKQLYNKHVELEIGSASRVFF